MISSPASVSHRSSTDPHFDHLLNLRDANVLGGCIRDLLDFMPDASFMVNSTGNIVLANALLASMFGYAHQELQGKSIDTLIPERFRRVHAGQFSEYFACPRYRTMGVGLALRALRKDGAEFPVEISLCPIDTDEGIFVLGAIRDISESEERYRAIFEQLAVGIVHSNSEGRFLNVNAKFCELLGYTRAEALTLDIGRVTHPDDLLKSVAARAPMLAGTAVPRSGRALPRRSFGAGMAGRGISFRLFKTSLLKSELSKRDANPSFDSARLPRTFAKCSGSPIP